MTTQPTQPVTTRPASRLNAAAILHASGGIVALVAAVIFFVGGDKETAFGLLGAGMAAFGTGQAVKTHV